MNEVFLEAAGAFERWRIEHADKYSELAQAAGSTEQARAVFIEAYVDGYNAGVAKERARCVAICELARGAGKRGLRLAQAFVDSGTSIEESFCLLVETEPNSSLSLAYQAITARTKEFA